MNKTILIPWFLRVLYVGTLFKAGKHGIRYKRIFHEKVCCLGSEKDVMVN